MCYAEIVAIGPIEDDSGVCAYVHVKANHPTSRLVEARKPPLGGMPIKMHQ